MVKKKEKKQRKWIHLKQQFKGNRNEATFQPGRLCAQLDRGEEIKCHVLIVPLLWRKAVPWGES